MSERISISQITTVGGSLRDDLAAYRAAGARGIGLWEMKLGEDAADLAAVRESGLAVTNCIPAVPSILPLPLMPGPDDPAERVEAICASVRRLAPFEPTAILCLTGPAGARAPAAARSAVVEGLRRIADEAEAAGIPFGVEPIQREFRDDWTLVSSIPETVGLLDEVGRPGLGILVDTWHLWNSETVLDDVRRERGRIVGVHVADWRDPTRNGSDRAMPGEGVADLAALVAALRDAGWEGWWDVEIFSDAPEDSLWTLEPDDAARRAVAGMRALLA